MTCKRQIMAKANSCTVSANQTLHNALQSANHGAKARNHGASQFMTLLCQIMTPCVEQETMTEEIRENLNPLENDTADMGSAENVGEQPAKSARRSGRAYCFCPELRARG